MAFTRTQMVAAVAGTLSLAVLTGCPASPTATNPAPSASASMAPATGTSAMPSTGTSAAPSAGASAGASTAPSTAPSTGASNAPTTAPSASGPAPSGKVVILSGNTYDEEGATVDGATITVKSLDTSVPYTATATTSQGSWVVNNVPEGANVEIVATKGGWTSRRRVGSFQQQATGRRNVINFGAAGGESDTNDDDPTGEAYFISDYPEIVSSDPVTDATGVDNQKLTFKIRLSEALDEDSRDTLTEALVIVPANEEANGTEFGGLDFETGEDDNSADGLQNVDVADTGDYAYQIKEGSTFLGNSDRDVTATWNAEGTELTFSFDATLIANESNEAKYQAVLVSQGGTGDDIIEDEDGNQLGTNDDGDLKSYPGVGEIITNAFKEVDLATKAVNKPGGGALSTGDANWASTHDSAVNWEIKRDETDPKLTGVDVSKDVDGDFRIELTFSEGMAAYDGGSGESSAELLKLEANYRFALGDKVGDTEDIDLGDDAPDDMLFTRVGADQTVTGSIDAVDINANGDQYGSNTELENEFTFGDTNIVGGLGADTDPTGDNDGAINIEVNEDNPNVVYIWVRGRTDLFENQASEIKAYVENVEDPAGNAISENDAEDNQVRGTI